MLQSEKKGKEILLTDSIKIVWDGSQNWVMHELRAPASTPKNPNPTTELSWVDAKLYFGSPNHAVGYLLKNKIPILSEDNTLSGVREMLELEYERMSEILDRYGY